MSEVIWKFPIQVGDTWLSIPGTWKALSAQLQDEQLCLWVLVDPLEPPVAVPVRVIGTGWLHDMHGWEHLSTVQRDGYVWHVFVPRAERGEGPQ
jgi:hypothetical protein